MQTTLRRLRFVSKAFVILTCASLALSGGPAGSVDSVSNNASSALTNTPNPTAGEWIPQDGSFQVTPFSHTRPFNEANLKKLAFSALLLAEDVSTWDFEDEFDPELDPMPWKPYRSVLIDVKALPGKRLLNKHVLWGLYQGMSWLLPYPQPRETRFFIRVGGDDIGYIITENVFGGSENSTGTAAARLGAENRAENTMGANGNMITKRNDHSRSRISTSDRQAQLNKRRRSIGPPEANSLIARQASSPENLAGTALVNGSYDDRRHEGYTTCWVRFHEDKPITFNNMMLTGIGGIAYAASLGRRNIVTPFSFPILHYTVDVSVAQPRVDIPFYIEDVINGIRYMLWYALEHENKKYELEADIRFRKRETLQETLLGRVAIRTPGTTSSTTLQNATLTDAVPVAAE